MGRGRQRAKQAKIARDLKYQTIPTDLAALQRELTSGPAVPDHREGASGPDGFDDDHGLGSGRL